MNKEEIIRMAHEAGAYTTKQYPDEFRMDVNDLERFVNLIAAAEREALETLIEQIKNDWDWVMDSQMKVYAAEYLLSAIRARGQG